MGLLDELKRIARPYEDEDEDDTFDDFDNTGRLDRTLAREKPAPRQQDTLSLFEPERAERRSNKVVNIHTTTQLQVVLVKPERFEDASSIADHLREKRTVVLNLEETNKDTARRLVDFLSGVAYTNGGQIKPVANSTYIITPCNVNVMGETMIDELGSHGIHF